MKLNTQSPLVVLCLFFSIITIFSCSKDSDLMADYVALDPEVLIGKYVRSDTFQVSIISNSEDDTFEITVNSGSGGAENSGNDGASSSASAGTTVNDTYQTSSSASIVLDVLANDTFKNLENVSISEISQPDNGEVVINSDNTLTYTPSAIEAMEDTFTYTAEFVKEDGTIGKETGNVTVTINEGSNKMGELKAFPGAEGFGKDATGGRGGEVIHVTNLNDSGAGSLRAAIDQTGTRTIVFDVGGNINLLSQVILSADEGDVTIAGQTAPFPGISILGEGVEIRDSNVIMRYLTFRIDDGNTSDQDCLRIFNAGANSATIENVILDHISISHGSDENFSIDGLDTTNSVKKITVQNSMFGKSSTTYNFLFGSHCYDVSVVNNYWAHTKDRHPLVGYGASGETLEYINNVHYGYEGGAIIAWGNTVDMLGNVYKAFPDNVPTYRAVQYGANSYNNPDALESDGDLYVADNYVLNDDSARVYTSAVTTKKEASRRITNSLISSWATTVSEIEASVFNANVGNSIHRDALDTEIINSYASETGSFYGGTVPSKTLVTRPSDYDTDGDGMSDTWENERGLNPSVADNNGDDDSDGYTNLETFLNTLVQ